MIFRVWAPAAKKVGLLLEGSRRLVMRNGTCGWWEIDADAHPGACYQFVLDDSDPLPDPRSPHQPQGVFAPSATIDHSAFRWADARWQPTPLSSAVLYELHIGTFTPAGTFDGAIERLDHLVDLGVTHVEIMPVNEFSGSRGWGYDGVFIFAPHHAYGGPDGLKRLVAACHARGLAVVLDVVYNHFGPEGSVMPRFGPYHTQRYKTPWGDAVNLDDSGSDEVRRFFCDNAAMWFRDYHCDVLRLDAIHAFADSTALPFLEQLAIETEALSAQLGRPLTLIAESNLNDPRFVRSRDAEGCGLDAQWDDDFHHAVHVTLTGEHHGYYVDFTPWRDVERALRHGFVYEGQYSQFRNRSHGRPAFLTGHQLVSFLQNHDQIGNRADGTRLSQLISPARCHVAAALLFASPFIPLLFQGEEWGARTPFPYFSDHQDPELRRAVSEGRREEFPDHASSASGVPDPHAPETFNSARLCWEEITRQPHASLFAWYKQLIALRKSEPDLLDGRLDRCVVRYDADAQWLTLARGRVQLACSLGNANRIPLDCETEERAVLASRGEVAISNGALQLGPDSVVLLRK